MELQRTRMFLLLAMFVVGVVLYGEWQKDHPSLPPAPVAVEKSNTGVPDVFSETQSVSQNQSVLPSSSPSSEWVNVKTDVLSLKIDPVGGDIVYAELLDYPEKLNSKEGIVLVNSASPAAILPQTGLISQNDEGPDSKRNGRAKYTVSQHQFDLGNNQDMVVDLVWHHPSGIDVVKQYSFKRGSYVVNVEFDIKNNTHAAWQGHLYGQLKQEATKQSNGMFSIQTYQGGAVSTPEKPYKKLSFSDMKKKTFRQHMEGGWAALVEHYFIAAWIPEKDSKNDYYSRVDNDIYSLIVTTPVVVAPGTFQKVSGQFYIGPEKAEILNNVAPGLALTIDYGILWPISLALFWLLKWIHSFVGNWGWSIIFVTLIIKVLFYKLSAASYRSMGNMRKIQPRVEALKEKHGDDRQGFSVAIMDLYRKEKINPLGGCLPILIQIPVFIALYYVLLESIELRQAPFMLWIQDLSAKDPYYVLPLIMGATMFLQQKMNPPPPDPMQAKIMMLMPLIFTVLFLSFPSGLVLYWTVNNLLSILQQWHITRSIERHSVLQKAK